MDQVATAQGNAAEEGGLLEKLKLPEFWCKLALLVVFAAFYLGARDYPEKARQFPQLLALVSLVLTVVSLAMDFLRKEAVAAEIGDVDDAELKAVGAEEKRARRGRFWTAWGIILASTGAGLLGGFLFTSLFLFVGAALLLGPRRKLARNLLISVAVTGLIYFVFQRLMSVPMLDGLLW